MAVQEIRRRLKATYHEPLQGYTYKPKLEVARSTKHSEVLVQGQAFLGSRLTLIPYSHSGKGGVVSIIHERFDNSRVSTCIKQRGTSIMVDFKVVRDGAELKVFSSYYFINPRNLKNGSVDLIPIELVYHLSQKIKDSVEQTLKSTVTEILLSGQTLTKLEFLKQFNRRLK